MPETSTISGRAMLKRLVPKSIRRALRKAARELPVRLRDFPADMRERQSASPLPPPRLRGRVALTSSREDFLTIGLRLWNSIAEALEGAAIPREELRDILDFGCGCGRVARHAAQALPHANLTGLDLDRDAIAWCGAHLAGSYAISPLLPPTSLQSESFDLIYAVSVFSHFDEPAQDLWLAELTRLLRPGGYFLASTHSPELTFERPDLGEEGHRRLQEHGFAFAPGATTFNEESAFHSPDYLREHWGRQLQFISHTPHGMAGYQDLTLLRKAP